MLIPADFIESKMWPAILTERALIRSKPAVYVLLQEREFGRLRGSSRILYIGSTGQFGGRSETCRLRIYRYPNGRHAKEIRRRVKLLIDSGAKVTLSWKYVMTKDAAKKQERRLLSQYREEHHELPPFNARNESH